MRSRYADTFDHDDDAASYDRIVRNEADPVRAGYGELLSWVVREAKIGSDSIVVDLGIGTGNTSRLISECSALIGVDVSAKMIALARPKLEHLASVRFVQSDLLEYFEGAIAGADAYISTYAVHHLLDEEKRSLFELVFDDLKPGGQAVFGDLMFADAKGRDSVIECLLSEGHADTVDEIGEEFLWDVASSVEDLEGIGFEARVKRFSDLSWGISCRKPVSSSR